MSSSAPPKERAGRTRSGRRIARRPVAVIAWGAAIFFVLLAIFGPMLVGTDPLRQDAAPLLPLGSPGHLLGTDDLGRDQLARLVYGARPLVEVSIFAAALSCIIGVVVGFVAGYRGGRLDQLLMRFTDLGMAMPSIVLIIIAVAIAGPGAGTLVVGVGIALAPAFARLTRTLALREASKDYILAARVGGSRLPRTLFREILPNIAGPILVQFVTTLSIAAGFAAGMSYLGLGIQPPTPDWGYMVQAGQEFIYSAPQLVLLPALLTVLFVAACSFVGDDLRDAIDVKDMR
ncbi:ABC transporter permease [Rhodococcus rhodochrous]|uniref:ABC transporter permease n=1 Tax=Rhodococcus rhodochrous TaxID=1829 RepID=UPI001E46170A|nr:ABC transporter permease [Rhodococcus rhodochrous]MCD2097064.1 ABC transporter permease [Rhodococcus rhodochrous]MCD2120504.1 ABC transporter permease [Rhodococcus rhodochrous]MCQ4137103.1 ABC transporter permease [Rhodococcus rhodochrous]MDJ0017369.1 ABC transporter permease [Rhodococcus rhodochrous]